MKKVTEYLFGTVLPCFVKKWQKKYATLVIAYLKRSWRKNYFFKRKPVKMGLKFNLESYGRPTSKSKKMKSLFMGVCEHWEKYHYFCNPEMKNLTNKKRIIQIWLVLFSYKLFCKWFKFYVKYGIIILPIHKRLVVFFVTALLEKNI